MTPGLIGPESVLSQWDEAVVEGMKWTHVSNQTQTSYHFKCHRRVSVNWVTGMKK